LFGPSEQSDAHDAGQPDGYRQPVTSTSTFHFTLQVSHED